MILHLLLLAQVSIGNNPVNLPQANFNTSFTSITQAVFAIAFLLSVIFVALGGFKYTTSNGDPQGIQKAKNTILYAVIGMAVSMSAYVIVAFVTGRV